MPEVPVLKNKKLQADEQKSLKSVVATIQNYIDFFGTWRTDISIHLLSNVIGKACFFITLIVQFIDMAMSRQDLHKVFEIYSVFSFCLMGALKLKSLTGNKDKWNKLLLTLNNLEEKQFNHERNEDDYESDGENLQGDFKSYFTKYTVAFQSLYKIIIKIYYSTLTIFSLSPLVEFAYWKVINEKDSVTNPHLLYGWTPLDDFGFWGYLVTILVEYIAAFYTIIFHTSFDLMVLGLMIILSGQFQLLRECSKHIAGNGEGYDITHRRDKRATLRIKKCHETLMILEHSVMELNQLVRSILGIYFMAAIFTLCSVALRLSVDEMSVMEVVTLVQYTSGHLIQLFLFCYYGDIVLHQSSVGVGEGGYACAWWRLSPRVRRGVLLLGVGQARVRRLRAGPFNTLGLVSFIQIVRTAYSYYAVIHK